MNGLDLSSQSHASESLRRFKFIPTLQHIPCLGMLGDLFMNLNQMYYSDAKMS